MLQLQNKNLVVVVVGCSGSGKSTFANLYLINGKFSCRFIFDPRGEYAERFKIRACRTAAELQAAVRSGWVIFDPSHLFPGDHQAGLENFCEWSWTIGGKIAGQKIVFVDEVWKHCSPNAIPKPLAMILMDGRKNGVGALLSTHRPNKLNDAITGEATELVCFSLTGTLKLEYLERNFDEFPVNKLPQLPPLHFIAQNLNSGRMFEGRVRF